MRRTGLLSFSNLSGLALCLSISLLTGCVGNLQTNIASTTGTTSTPTTTTAGSGNLYAVVPGFSFTNGTSTPYTVFIFGEGLSGTINDQVGHTEVPGNAVGVDATGNIYTAQPGSLNFAGPYGTTGGLFSSPAILVGSGDPVAALTRFAVSPAGHVFISDGTGVAAFDSGAVGSTSPSRYIVGKSSSGAFTPGHLAADATNNLYVENTVDSSINIFLRLLPARPLHPERLRERRLT